MSRLADYVAHEAAAAITDATTMRALLASGATEDEARAAIATEHRAEGLARIRDGLARIGGVMDRVSAAFARMGHAGRSQL